MKAMPSKPFLFTFLTLGLLALPGNRILGQTCSVLFLDGFENSVVGEAPAPDDPLIGAYGFVAGPVQVVSGEYIAGGVTGPNGAHSGDNYVVLDRPNLGSASFGAVFAGGLSFSLNSLQQNLRIEFYIWAPEGITMSAGFGLVKAPDFGPANFSVWSALEGPYPGTHGDRDFGDWNGADWEYKDISGTYVGADWNKVVLLWDVDSATLSGSVNDGPSFPIRFFGGPDIEISQFWTHDSSGGTIYFLDDIRVEFEGDSPPTCLITRSPEAGAEVSADTNFRYVLGNGTQNVQVDTIELFLNGAPVDPTITPSNGLTVVEYDPPSPLQAGENTVRLVYQDDADPPNVTDIEYHLWIAEVEILRPPWEHWYTIGVAALGNGDEVTASAQLAHTAVGRDALKWQVFNGADWVDTGLSFTDREWNKVNWSWDGTNLSGSLNDGDPVSLGLLGTPETLLDRMLFASGVDGTVFYVDDFTIRLTPLPPFPTRIFSQSPQPGATGASSNAVIEYTLQNGEQQVRINSIEFVFDGQPVDPVITQDGDFTHVSYDPDGLELASMHTVQLAFEDDADPANRTETEFSFAVVTQEAPPPLQGTLIFADGFENSELGGPPGEDDPKLGSYAFGGTVEVVTGEYTGGQRPGPSRAQSGLNYIALDRETHGSADLSMIFSEAVSLSGVEKNLYLEFYIWMPEGNVNSICFGLSNATGPFNTDVHTIWSALEGPFEGTHGDRDFGDFTGDWEYKDISATYVGEAWNKVVFFWEKGTASTTLRINDGPSLPIRVWGSPENEINRIWARACVGGAVAFLDNIRVMVDVEPLRGVIFLDGFENSAVGGPPAPDDPVVGEYDVGGTVEVVTGEYTGGQRPGPTGSHSGNNYLALDRETHGGSDIAAIFNTSLSLDTAENLYVEYYFWMPDGNQNSACMGLSNAKSPFNSEVQTVWTALEGPYSGTNGDRDFGDYTGDWAYKDIRSTYLGETWNKVAMFWDGLAGTLTGSVNDGPPFSIRIWGSLENEINQFWTRACAGDAVYFIDDVLVIMGGDERPPDYTTRIKSSSPEADAADVGADATISFTLNNGAQMVQVDTIKLLFDGERVDPTVVQDNGTTTVTYQPPESLELGSSHTVRLEYEDDADPPNREEIEYGFTVEAPLPPPPPRAPLRGIVPIGGTVVFLDGFENSELGGTPAPEDPVVGSYDSGANVEVVTGEYIHATEERRGPAGAHSGDNYLALDREALGGDARVNMLLDQSLTLNSVERNLFVEFEVWMPDDIVNSAVFALTNENSPAASAVFTALEGPFAGTHGDRDFGDFDNATWDYKDIRGSYLGESWNRIVMFWDKATETMWGSVNDGPLFPIRLLAGADADITHLWARVAIGGGAFFLDDVLVLADVDEILTDVLFDDGFELSQAGGLPSTALVGDFSPVGESLIVTGQYTEGAMNGPAAAYSGDHYLALDRAIGSGGLSMLLVDTFSLNEVDWLEAECYLWIPDGPQLSASFGLTSSSSLSAEDFAIWTALEGPYPGTNGDRDFGDYNGSDWDYKDIRQTYVGEAWNKLAFSWVKETGTITASINDGEEFSLRFFGGPDIEINQFYSTTAAGGTVYFLDDVRVRAPQVSAAPGDPELRYSVAGMVLTLTWDADGFNLQWNEDLNNPDGWTDLADGGASPVDIDIDDGSLFLRLIKP